MSPGFLNLDNSNTVRYQPDRVSIQLIDRAIKMFALGSKGFSRQLGTYTSPNADFVVFVAEFKALCTLVDAPISAPRTLVDAPISAPRKDLANKAEKYRMGVMQIPTLSELTTRLLEARSQGKTVGFVPTMGYLHDGHRSLLTTASQANDITVASIFVNPLQFAPDEDLDQYPQNLHGDIKLAEEAGVDLIFTPTTSEMYPTGVPLTTVKVSDLTDKLEGASRPGHFDGVSTVLTKLFSIVGPCTAYFGEKDFQQLTIVKQLATDLNLPVEVVGVPTVREHDGLAKSSRNIYLNVEQRQAATVLSRSLEVGKEAIKAGQRSRKAVEAAMAKTIQDEPLAKLDYVAAVNSADLTSPETLTGETRLLVAAQIGTTRLIDNKSL